MLTFDKSIDTTSKQFIHPNSDDANNELDSSKIE